MQGTQDRAMSALPPIPASKYLIDDRPLVVKLQLVRLIGFKAAIVLQQVRYWLGEDRRPQVRDGHPWVYNTYPDWQKQFPFWPVSTIKETFLELEREGLLLSGHFNARNTDRTKWYTIPPNVIRDLDRRAQTDAVPQARRRGARRENDALPALPESNLLIDRDTLIILPRLAARIGLNEAIVLQQVFYWLGGDRKPHVRDGRRWVYNTYEGWREQFPFLSERTIRRTIRELEQTGLLESAFFTDHPEHRHLDHTKWYTIDFDQLAVLQSADPIAACVPPQGTGSVPPEAVKRHHSTATITATGNGQESTIGRAGTNPTKRPEGDIGSGHDATVNMVSNGQWKRPEAPTGAAIRGRVSRPESNIEPAKIRHSSSTEISSEIPAQRTQQQQQVIGTGEAEPGKGNVVVTVYPEAALVASLVERRVTQAAARKLVKTHPPAMIANQIEVFDWLREVDPEDERYSAGRLRRMIEEDWTPPPGFVSAAMREQRARETAEVGRLAREERARWVAEHEAQRVRGEDERRGRLARIGVTDEDQLVWRRVLELPRPLASPLAELLRRALFYAPRDGNPALIIVRDEADLALIQAEHHARGRAEVDRRVARQCHRSFADVRYAHYAMIATLLHDGTDEASVSTMPSISMGTRQNAK